MSNPATGGSESHTLENHAQRDVHRQMIRDLTNGNAEQVQFVVNNFSNGVLLHSYSDRKVTTISQDRIILNILNM